MDAQALAQLTKARAGLILDQPFFGALALRLKLVEDSNIPTLAVNGKAIKYNPDYVKTLSLPLTKSALGHEVMHCVFDHMDRLGEREHKRWNHAGDYVINQVLEDSGFEIGATWLHSPAFKGMSTDEIYNQLPPDPPGESQDQLEPGEPDPAQRAANAREWQIATGQAAQAAKMMGKLPGTLERFVEDMMKPQVNWREVLRRFVDQASKNDFSWRRPNRGALAQGVLLPGLFSESCGKIQSWIDTSGSIDQHTLNVFGAEVSSVIEEVRPEETEVGYCDASINHIDTFKDDEPVKFNMHGGGGTDFRPPFQRNEDEQITPVCMIYLTDGYGAFPDQEPDYPVLWVMTTDVKPPFGESVRIEV